MAIVAVWFLVPKTKEEGEGMLVAPKLICKDCGSRNNGRTKIKGGLLTEIFLWCFFLVPGIFYSIWRMSTKEKVCNSCEGHSLISIDSPVGRKLSAEFSDVA